MLFQHWVNDVQHHLIVQIFLEELLGDLAVFLLKLVPFDHLGSIWDVRETLSAYLLDLWRGCASIEDSLSRAIGKGVLSVVSHLVELNLRSASVLRVPLGHASTVLTFSSLGGFELLSNPGSSLLVLPGKRRDPLL